jgi:hypothetical protein
MHSGTGKVRGLGSGVDGHCLPALGHPSLLGASTAHACVGVVRWATKAAYCSTRFLFSSRP